MTESINQLSCKDTRIIRFTIYCDDFEISIRELGLMLA
jgi:hypothetical protein